VAVGRIPGQSQPTEPWATPSDGPGMATGGGCPCSVGTAAALLPASDPCCCMTNRRLGYCGGSPAASPSFWTLMKYFWAWLRICTHTLSQPVPSTSNLHSSSRGTGRIPPKRKQPQARIGHDLVTWMVVLVRTCSSIFFQSRPNLKEMSRPSVSSSSHSQSQLQKRIQWTTSGPHSSKLT
jgi:hypothetical protein